MLLYHDGILSAIDRLLCGACYDSVLRLCADNYLLCARNDHGLLCSGADDDLLRADNCLLCGASHVHELLPRDIHLSDYVLCELSTLAVVAISCSDLLAMTWVPRQSNTPCLSKWILPPALVDLLIAATSLQQRSRIQFRCFFELPDIVACCAAFITIGQFDESLRADAKYSLNLATMSGCSAATL